MYSAQSSFDTPMTRIRPAASGESSLTAVELDAAASGVRTTPGYACEKESVGCRAAKDWLGVRGVSDAAQNKERETHLDHAVVILGRRECSPRKREGLLQTEVIEVYLPAVARSEHGHRLRILARVFRFLQKRAEPVPDQPRVA